MIEIKELTTTNSNEELENIFYTLYGYRRNGEEAYIDFEGHRITTNDVATYDSFDKLFFRVYGCSYDEHVKKKAEASRELWIEKGFELIAPEKQEEWIKFVDQTIENISFYHCGNPVLDTLEVLYKVNMLEDPEELKEVIASLDGSNNILIKAAIVFSNKGEQIQEIYAEIRKGPKM